ncbi:DUF5655 domain-containing protein [Coralliovum pocilloporae]|uniref:DUF5655 domain-containing protein n=1 Tax=Coralliovum pocilloporae TaxID=3066369 RepID=UPI0033074FE1
MSDLKLFRMDGDTVSEIPGTMAALEKSLQVKIERNLEAFLGVRFLASEFSTGKEHGGRIDTIGIDENNCPVIIEYKRSTNANVINQGLYYLDWLMTHRGDFEMLVLRVLGEESAKTVEWSNPRLICIAGDFTKYDEHAIKQMNHNIELIRYVQFGADLLLLEQVNAVSASIPAQAGNSATNSNRKAAADRFDALNAKASDLYELIKEYLVNLGDDVQVRPLKHYVAFRRIKNFVCVHPRAQDFLLFVKLDPSTVPLEEGFMRDVAHVGHLGTGNLEITVGTPEDFERAKVYLHRSYEGA